MWKRRELKRAARKNLKRSYLAAVALCFLLAFLGGEFSESTQAIWAKEDTGSYQIATRRAGGENETDPSPEEAPTALENLAIGLFNAATSNHSWAVRLVAGGLFALGAVLTLGFQFLIGNPLQVGGRRFFLVARGQKADVLEFFYAFRGGRYRHTVWVMLRRRVSVYLWTCLLILPGLIKSYQYRLVPYLLAGDAALPAGEVLRRSRELMRGHKRRAFLLDLSFAGWSLLSALTFGLTGILYSNPYLIATECELFCTLRGAEKVPLAPVQPLNIKEYVGDCRVNYGLSNYILFFFSFSLMGWLWEVGFHMAQFGEFVNRGTMAGPWLPIYGSGGVIVLLLLRKWFHKPVRLFVFSTVLCSIIEYASSWVLETATGLRWWDYSDYFLNLNGRVCLEGAIVFGVGCCAAVYLAAPALGKVYDRIPKAPKTALCLVLLALFAGDGVRSMVHPNTGEGITGLPAGKDFYDNIL